MTVTNRTAQNTRNCERIVSLSRSENRNGAKASPHFEILNSLLAGFYLNGADEGPVPDRYRHLVLAGGKPLDAIGAIPLKGNAKARISFPVEDIAILNFPALVI